ncbi:YolD-like family protein [Neobacillus massiliamazoniensis]|uniref:YolD-like protein n=1 Tax=Neobacillus massiliamazoniensis TaxID=1499688 RepID=A0A0U1P2L1_9BACI|nr:YolD-like family protein [Neobacillus massiliamazoniensis]CRK84554.1 YolD-like protein [Neobacillus massiliamazoniensis]
MAIRDRGMMKWQAAFQLPELAKTQRDFWRYTERQAKPIIDEHEAEEFDLRIIYAMEYDHSVKLTVWDDGFTLDITGRIHYVDPITHELRIEVMLGGVERVSFDSIVRVKVVN